MKGGKEELIVFFVSLVGRYSNTYMYREERLYVHIWTKKYNMIIGSCSLFSSSCTCICVGKKHTYALR